MPNHFSGEVEKQLTLEKASRILNCVDGVDDASAFTGDTHSISRIVIGSKPIVKAVTSELPPDKAR